MELVLVDWARTSLTSTFFVSSLGTFFSTTVHFCTNVSAILYSSMFWLWRSRGCGSLGAILFDLLSVIEIPHCNRIVDCVSVTVFPLMAVLLCTPLVTSGYDYHQSSYLQTNSHNRRLIGRLIMIIQ